MLRQPRATSLKKGKSTGDNGLSLPWQDSDSAAQVVSESSPPHTHTLFL